MIKQSREKPPAHIYDRCVKEFGVSWDKGIVFTYGDTVHSKYPIGADLEAHEATHIRQQAAMGKDIWWERYFTDKEFRLSQELEAYRNQLIWIHEHYNRHMRQIMFKHIIKSMVNLYGDMCTEEDAINLLQK